MSEGKNIWILLNKYLCNVQLAFPNMKHGSNQPYTPPKINSLNLKMMGLEDDFPDFQGARILRWTAVHLPECVHTQDRDLLY